MLTVSSAQPGSADEAFTLQGLPDGRHKPSAAPLSPSSSCACILDHYEEPTACTHTKHARLVTNCNFRMISFSIGKGGSKMNLLSLFSFFFLKIETIFIDFFLATKVL